MALGVADNGHGLSEKALESAKLAISTSASFNLESSTRHGAQHTGFDLYHAHLQTRALGTRLHLSTLQNGHDLLNEDMIDASRQYQQQAAKQKGSSLMVEQHQQTDNNLLFHLIALIIAYERVTTLSLGVLDFLRFGAIVPGLLKLLVE